MNENYLRVPYGLSVHAEEELQAVTDVLQTSTQMGSRTQDLEERVSKLFSKDYGIMVNSGSSALYVGMETLGLKEGSEVITPVLSVHNLVMGTPYIDMGGTTKHRIIGHPELECTLKFTKKGWL